MLSYAALDHIADAVNPILGLTAMILPWFRPYSMQRRAWVQIAATLAVVAVAYAWQWVDARLALWSALTLNYSTHTAVFAALALALWQLRPRWRVVLPVLGVAYAALMIYQRYHTIADILSTLAVVLPAMLLLWRGFARGIETPKTA